MTDKLSVNNTFDRDLYLHRISMKKPSSRYKQEQNFIELFKLAGIERMYHERNMAYYAQRIENGAGI